MQRETLDKINKYLEDLDEVQLRIILSFIKNLFDLG